MASYTVTLARIEEQVDGGRRLGRHLEHDSRSLRYAFKAPRRTTIVSARHSRNVPVFDQGDLGSCTGNAAAGALSTSPFWDGLPQGTVLNEAKAVSLYSKATHLDNVTGVYPPTDTGSTGLAVAKACQQAQLVSGYQHALTLNDALTALSFTSVLVGMNWYDSFDQPDPNGLVTIPTSAYVRGGHEIYFDEVDVSGRLVWFTNSWGMSWSQSGRACMSWDTFDRLLGEQGDVVVMAPANKPAPTPTPTPVPPVPAPTPTPDTVDQVMWHAMQSWAKAKGLS